MTAKPDIKLGLVVTYTCPRKQEVVTLQGRDALNALTGWSDEGDEGRYSSDGINFSVYNCAACGKSHEEYVK